YTLLALLDHRRRKSHEAKRRKPTGEAYLDLYQWSVQAELRPARHPGYGHGGRCSRRPPVSATGCGSAPGSLGHRAGERGALERRQPRLERLELRTRALENACLSIEFVAAHQIELAQPLAQHGAEVALEVHPHAPQCGWHALEQSTGELINTKCIHSCKASVCCPCPDSGQGGSRRLQYGAAPISVRRKSRKPRGLRRGMESAPFPRASPAYATSAVRAAGIRCANHRKQTMPTVARTRWPTRLSAALAVLAPGLSFAADAPLPNKGDTAWMLTATALVLLMSVPALALFYGGLVRTKNMLSVLMQVFVGFSLITVLWCIYGYSLAFTEGPNSIIGGFSRLFLNGTFDPKTGNYSTVGTFDKGVELYELVYVGFQATFAAITCCLILGSLVAPIKFSAVILFLTLWFTFSYLPVAHMVWYWPGPDAFTAGLTPD